MASAYSRVTQKENHLSPVTTWHTTVHYQLLCDSSDSKDVCVCAHTRVHAYACAHACKAETDGEDRPIMLI